METFVIRSQKQRQNLFEYLLEKRLPFKGALQDIYPQRSPEANAYYWGVMMRMISDYTGHTPKEVHRAYKRKFNINYWPHPKTWTWDLRIQSTTEFDSVSFEQYCLMVRADAEIEIGVTIPLPNESFIKQLKIQTL